MNNMRTLHLPSPAKLNLFLYITGQRHDGYHELQTLFQFIDLMDWLTFEPTANSAIILEDRLHSVAMQDNLIIHAAYKLLPYATHPQTGVKITLEKHIPLGAGLGGASSNAATTLLALNYLWQCHLSQQQLSDIATTLGADVPIFIHGHAAFAQGVGDNLSDAFPSEKWYIIQRPSVSIATESVFADIALPRNTPKKNFSTLMQQPFSNDCEAVVRLRYPVVDEAIKQLSQYAPTRLTGTGSCVFAEFSKQTDAIDVFNQINRPDITVFLTKGENISPLHTALIQVLSC